MLLAPPAACGRKTGEVRHRRPGRQHAAPCGREPKQFLQPADEICSSRIANGELTQLNAIWSSAPLSQSAASDAGVPPPMTKWKKRGPADRVPATAACIDQDAECLERAGAFVGQRAAEALDGSGPHRRTYESFVDAGEIPRGLVGDQPQAILQRLTIQDRVAHR